MIGKFVLRNAQDGSFYFVLAAPNGEIIAQSEMYQTKEGAKNGIESVQHYASTARLFDETTVKPNEEPEETVEDIEC